MAKTLRSVECRVCLRGEKICHFGVVVYSNVRECAPIRGFYAPPYLPPFRPPFSIHIGYSLLNTTCRLPHLETLPNTRNFNFCFYSAQKHSGVCDLSVRQGEFGFLLIVSRASWSQVGVCLSFSELFTSPLVNRDRLGVSYIQLRCNCHALLCFYFNTISINNIYDTFPRCAPTY